jgi:PAS domain S-box-containing protein
MVRQSVRAGDAPALDVVLLDLARDATIGVDGRRHTVIFNAAAARFLGYEPAEVLGRSVALILPALGASLDSPLEDHLSPVRLDGPSSQGQRVTCRRKDGSEVMAELLVSRASHQGRVILMAVLRDLADSDASLAPLRAEETRHPGLFDGMIEGFQLIGHDWCLSFVNDVVCAHLGKSRNELLGRTIMQVYPGIEQTSLFVALRRCMAERRSQRVENSVRHPDGSTRSFAHSIQPVPEGIFVLSTDTTNRKESAFGTGGQLRQLQAVRQIDMAILGGHELQPMLDVVVTETIKTLHVQAARVLLLQAEAATLVTVAHRGFPDESAQERKVRLGVGLAGRCALERRPLVSDDPTEISGLAATASPPQERFVASAAAPLVAKGQVRGVLEVCLREKVVPSAYWLSFLEALADQAAIALENATAFQELRRANAELHLAYDATIEGWSRAMDLRDKETEGHTLRVTEMTMRLARTDGMSEDELVQIRRGCLLHDIGKLGVPDQILFKEGPLTDDEWVLMRKHPTYAYEMLFPIAYLRPALDIPYCHHEKWDGTGYPRGRQGETIPRAARLFAVVDVWDALRSDRPYRAAWPEDRVLEHIRGLSGTHFDPEACRLFDDLIRSGVHGLQPVIGTTW